MHPAKAHPRVQSSRAVRGPCRGQDPHPALPGPLPLQPDADSTGRSVQCSVFPAHFTEVCVCFDFPTAKSAPEAESRSVAIVNFIIVTVCHPMSLAPLLLCNCVPTSPSEQSSWRKATVSVLLSVAQLTFDKHVLNDHMTEYFHGLP